VRGVWAPQPENLRACYKTWSQLPFFRRKATVYGRFATFFEWGRTKRADRVDAMRVAPDPSVTRETPSFDIVVKVVRVH
jgi:hypothetical protein